MKGTASINPIFQQSQIIQQPQIFNIHPLTVADHRSHSIHFRNISKKIEPKIVINTCYSAKYSVLMMLTEDGRLRIYTQTFQEIARIPWQSKYSVGFQFIDEKDAMLMIGATQIQMLYVKVHSNIKSTKFISSMTFNIQKLEKYIVQPETKLQWNKGFNLNRMHNLLYLWSSKDINFYSLKSMQILSHIPCLTRKELSITYVYYNNVYKYTITGLINGHIKVWRLPVSIYGNNSVTTTHNNSQVMQHSSSTGISKDYILIHNYIKHTKAIDKIIEVNFKGIHNNEKQNNVIISSSLELTVCFWSLETFELLRFYDFQGQYASIYLHNSVYSLAIKDNYLGVLNWGKNLQFITDITSQIINFDKYRPEFTFNQSTKIQSLQITLGSNIGFQICDQHLDAKDLNKTQIQYIYPPLKAKGIQQIVSSPYAHNQYYLLVENGEIYKLRMQDNSGRIQQSYQIERAKDMQYHQLNQLPSIICFLPILPPKFDTEINQNSIEKNEDQHDENQNNPKHSEKKMHQQQNVMSTDYLQAKKENYFDMKLIAVGCNKGAIVFFKITDFEHIHTRVTYHRQAITELQSFTKKQTDTEYIVSHCLQNYLKVIKLDKKNEKASCLLSIFTGGYLTKLRCFEDRIAVVLKKGMFDIFQLQQPENSSSTLSLASSSQPITSKSSIPILYCNVNESGDDHEQQIYTLDCDTNNKLILTAAADNVIKIWTYYKVLLYQVFLDDGLKGAIWFRDKQMLVSHSAKILYFRRIGLRITIQEINQANQQYLETGVDIMDIKDVLKTMHKFSEQDSQHKQHINIDINEFKQSKQLHQKDHKSPHRKQKTDKNLGSRIQTKNKDNMSQIMKMKSQPPINAINIENTNIVTSSVNANNTLNKSRIKQSKSNSKNSRNKQQHSNRISLHKSHAEEEEQKHRNSVQDSDLSAMRKHLEDMKQLKKITNQPILPKIGPKSEDTFDSFMKSKLLNKKILTRRDITLNRIIMKNIIKQHFGSDSDVANNLKLDF